MITSHLIRYDSCDKIRLPTKLYVNDLDDNVIKVDALEEFEEMKEMQVSLVMIG